jgi:hypothetical protein
VPFPPVSVVVPHQKNEWVGNSHDDQGIVFATQERVKTDQFCWQQPAPVVFLVLRGPLCVEREIIWTERTISQKKTEIQIHANNGHFAKMLVLQTASEYFLRAAEREDVVWIFFTGNSGEFGTDFFFFFFETP